MKKKDSSAFSARHISHHNTKANVEMGKQSTKIV